MVDQLVRALWNKSRYARLPNYLPRFASEVRPAVEREVGRFWPVLDYQVVFLGLLSDPPKLQGLGRGAVSPALAEALAQSLPAEDGQFSDTDLAPLLYLDHLLNDHPTQAFEHVVLDEAQDVSSTGDRTPEEALPKRTVHDPRGRAPAPVPYRGITNWRQVSALFNQADVARYDSRTSYRCTYEITRFANRILRRVAGSTAPPVPYEGRHGDRPRWERSETFRAMLEAIAADVMRLKQQGAASIGVLCKWNREARAVHEYLSGTGIDGVALLEPSATLTGRVTVSPVLLTKAWSSMRPSSLACTPTTSRAQTLTTVCCI